MKATFAEFITRIKTVGLPSPTHFHIVIPDETKLNLMLCESITLPGFNVMTQELRIFGELSELPHAPIYNAVTATFIMDNNAQPRKFFLGWLQKVFNRESRQVGYYADYTKDIEIHITDKASGSVLFTKLYECYPKSVQDIELSYSGDHIVKFSVQFIYKWATEFTEKTTGSGSQQNQPNPSVTQTKTVSGLPVGGGINQQTQGIQNQITNTLPPSNIPKSQVEFNQQNLNGDFGVMEEQINDGIGEPQNQILDAIENITISEGDKALILGAVLRMGKDSRLFAKAISKLKQDSSKYVDTFENRVQIGDSIISLGITMGQIQNMLEILESPVDLSELQLEMGRIGLNIKLANSQDVVNRQLAQFGQVFQAAGAELEKASNKIPDSFNENTKESVNKLSAQFMQIGLNISALQAALP